jgi:Mrp family chromosome partitioning ATPase
MVRLVTSISSASEEHPGRIAVEKEIQSMDLRLAEIQKETKERIIKQVRNEQNEEAQKEKIKIEEEMKLAQIQEAALQEDLNEQKDSVTQQAMMFNAALNLKSRIEQNRIRLDAIERRLDFFRTEENAPGFVKISSLARQPDKPALGKGMKILGAIFAIGMILCLGLPVLIDLLNPWINTPAEIEQVLKLPILGWIMHKGKNKKFKHHAFFQDQVKRLAMKMHELKLKEQCSSFVITSIKPGGGATTLVQEFSKELKGLGFNSLCIEANALSQEKYEKNYKGLNDVLSKKSTLEEVILKNSLGIDQIYLGEENEEKHLPLDQDFFKSIKKLEYDFFLYDSPPLLLTADAELLVRQCDAVLLIIEAGSTQNGEVKRSLKTLEMISPKQVGFIMNKVKIKKNSGYFHEILKEFETGKKVS